jgi:hypothetical protein
MTTFIDPPLLTSNDEFAVADDRRGDTRSRATTSLKRALTRTPTVADQYSGLLDDLSPGQRRGLIANLSVGYYEGWRPTRAQLARHIHDEFGVSPRNLLADKNPASAARLKVSHPEG